MRFGVLGQVQVWTAEGEPVAIPETKVRALLADLLAHQGGAVPAERLIEDLWGGHLPADPANSLQLKVSRLRHALARAEPGGGDLIVSHPYGYQLTVEPGQTDAGSFTGLITRAGRTRDLHERAAVLAEALALWRGPAYADVADEAFVRSAVDDLEEQRLAALASHAETRLDLGEDGLLIGELSDLVERHPLHERLRAVQMRALYRSGRQSEALAGYDELRERLTGELGRDPGPELAALHQAILEQASALHPAASAVHPAASAVRAAPPRTNVPAPLTTLVGRDQAVHDLRSRLASSRLVTLTGPGGVGKTRLAIETARRAVEDHPDGAWLVELAGHRRIEEGLEPGSSPGVEALSRIVSAAIGIRDDTSAPALPAPAPSVGEPSAGEPSSSDRSASDRSASGPSASGPSASGPSASGPSSSEQLAEALRGKDLLLVLDNCEHVIDLVAELVERLLRTAPGLHVLATSREPLALAGEQVWTVPPLTLPDLDRPDLDRPDLDQPGLDQPGLDQPGLDRPGLDRPGLAPPGELARSGAVQLLTQRVTVAMPGFALDASNARQVAELCRRLDGIPLALELAATRVPALGVHELLARLDDRFRLLTTGRRDAPERQQTLRAVIDWSWDLLTEPERIVLRRLAVHQDGCTRGAARAVCADGEIDSDSVLDVLAHLVDRSLVVVTETAGGPRYRLLETVSEYCLLRLREAGEVDRVLSRCHRYYVELAGQARPHLRGGEQRQWLDRLDAESANLHATLDSMIVHNDAAGALDAAITLVWPWFLLGRIGQARSALRRALAAEGDAPAALRVTAVAWETGLRLLTETGADREARARAVAIPFEDIEDPDERAQARWFLGYALYTSESDLAASEDHVSQALAGFRATGNRWGSAAALSTTTRQAMVRGDLRAIKQFGQESARLFRELGDRWGQLQTIRPLAYLAEVSGDYEQAVLLQREGLRMAEELRFWPEVADRLMGLGRIALLRRDFAQARELHDQCRRLSFEQSYWRGVSDAETGLALIARREGDLDLAEELLTNLLDRYRGLGFAPGPALFLAELGFVAEQRGDARTAMSRHLEGLTHARAARGPHALALALEGLAGAHALLGHHGQAAQLLGAADAARRAAGAPLPAAERGDVDRITARVRAALGEQGFAAEFERGAALRPDAHGVTQTLTALGIAECSSSSEP